MTNKQDIHTFYIHVPINKIDKKNKFIPFCIFSYFNMTKISK